MKLQKLPQVTAALILAFSAATTQAAAIHDTGLFSTNILNANDDGSTSAVNLGFSALINNSSFSQLYVNNNGNVTFGSSLSGYTPAAILGGSNLIIAPFWADVDTRGANSGLATYGSSVLGGRNVFGVNWLNVGYYNGQSDKLNSFQLILTDRSDVAAGDFDIQFNYDTVKWETGSASGGTNGLGGSSAAAGYSVNANNAYQLAGSFVNGALLDGGSNSLVGHSLNSNVLGQYNFQVRNGAIISPVPEPETYALMLAGLGMVGFVARKRRKVGGAPKAA